MKLMLVVVALLPLTHAWFSWGGSRRQRAVSEVSEECIQKAQTGDCHFYTCFDERHPCTTHNFALSYGWRFCIRYDQEYQRFTDQAKQWIDNSRQCTMQSMLEFYRDEYINCEDVEHAMKDAHAQCEAEHGVCADDLVWENREVLLDIYQFSLDRQVQMYDSQIDDSKIDEDQIDEDQIDDFQIGDSQIDEFKLIDELVLYDCFIYIFEFVLFPSRKFSRKGLLRFLLYVRECGSTELEHFLDWMGEQKDVVIPHLESMRDYLASLTDRDWSLKGWGINIPEFNWPSISRKQAGSGFSLNNPSNPSNPSNQ